MNQTMQALAKANEVRPAGSAWRRSVAEQPGEEGVEAVARTLNGRLPPYVAALTVERFLTAIEGVGPKKASVILDEAHIHRFAGAAADRRAPTVRIRDLDQGERKRLRDVLRGYMAKRVRRHRWSSSP